MNDFESRPRRTGKLALAGEPIAVIRIVRSHRSFVLPHFRRGTPTYRWSLHWGRWFIGSSRIR